MQKKRKNRRSPEREQQWLERVMKLLEALNQGKTLSEAAREISLSTAGSTGIMKEYLERTGEFSSVPKLKQAIQQRGGVLFQEPKTVVRQPSEVPVKRDKKTEQFVALYVSGQSLGEIAEQKGYTPSHVRRMVQSYRQKSGTELYREVIDLDETVILLEHQLTSSQVRHLCKGGYVAHEVEPWGSKFALYLRNEGFAELQYLLEEYGVRACK